MIGAKCASCPSMRVKGGSKGFIGVYGLAMRFMILLALGVGVYLSTHFWRIIFLVFFALYLVIWVRLASQAQAVEIIRRYRHRYANHLQVISGWLQLGQYERADKYLMDHALASVHPGIFRGLPLRWTYQMIALDAYAESLGNMILWQNPEHIAGTYVMLWKLRAVLRCVIPLAKGTIVVRFEPGRFNVEVDEAGMKALPRKHIKGVRWNRQQGMITASWGHR